MKKEDKSLIDVENDETTGERCCHLSWRTPLNSSLCTFIEMKHISPTFCVYHTNVFEAGNIYQNPPPKCNFPKQNSIFFSLWGSTYDSADCWSAHRPPSARDSFKRVHDWWVASAGCPPNKNPAVNIHDRIFLYTQVLLDRHTLRFVESVLAPKSVPVHRTDYGLGVLKSFRIRYHIGIFSFLQKPNFAAVT